MNVITQESLQRPRPSAARVDSPVSAPLSEFASATSPVPLARVWEELLRGRLRPLCEVTTSHRIEAYLRPADGRPLSHDDARLVVHVLSGQARKALADDLGIATSTATGRVLRALSKLELVDHSIPLPLVLAAQSWAGASHVPSGRVDVVDHEGRRCLAVSVPRPATARMTRLTHVQQLVAQCLIEGFTRQEIAERRKTSVYTVSRQFHSVFSCLRVTGRYAVIQQAAFLRCFDEPEDGIPESRHGVATLVGEAPRPRA